MKLVKKFFCFLLTGLLVLSAAAIIGCGNSSSDGDGDGDGEYDVTGTVTGTWELSYTALYSLLTLTFTGTDTGCQGFKTGEDSIYIISSIDDTLTYVSDLEDLDSTDEHDTWTRQSGENSEIVGQWTDDTDAFTISFNADQTFSVSGTFSCDVSDGGDGGDGDGGDDGGGDDGGGDGGDGGGGDDLSLEDGDASGTLTVDQDTGILTFETTASTYHSCTGIVAGQSINIQANGPPTATEFTFSVVGSESELRTWTRNPAGPEGILIGTWSIGTGLATVTIAGTSEGDLTFNFSGLFPCEND